MKTDNAIIWQMTQLGSSAKIAASDMLASSARDRKTALLAIADNIDAQSSSIRAANQCDLGKARENQLNAALLDRLELTPARIQAMVAGVRQIADQADPIGQISHLNIQSNGLQVGKMRTPIGVIGMIYESRPNVTVDAAAICIKSGNACILRGGSEAFHSNQRLAVIIREAIAQTTLNDNIIQFVDNTDRQAVNALLQLPQYIDVIIPRGGKSLVKLISDKACVPVIKHLDGICHVYIDETCDERMAIAVAYNSKAYRYGICGAMETLLVHQGKVDTILPPLIAKYQAKGIELLADGDLARQFSLASATDEDWYTEYLGPRLSIKTVANIDEAIAHINRYGSHHTDAIITDSLKHQQQFLALVDSASVMVNTATCFADGFEYGLGAEIGISTDKLHARGPVGVMGLTTEKYIVFSNGETRQS